MNFFADFEITCCAAHVEAKRLSNKYYTQYRNLGDKLSELEDPIKIENTGRKLDKIRLQLNESLQGVLRCCAKDRNKLNG